MSNPCEWCDGACAGADLAPLLDPRLTWLWEQIGRAADRRGDSSLEHGMLKVTAPIGAEERAAAAGLLGDRALLEGQRRAVDFAQLMQKLRVRGPTLTPGSVAAHALRRRLAVQAAANREQQRKVQQLNLLFQELAASAATDILEQTDSLLAALLRSGWLTRLANTTEAERVMRSAVTVVQRLPEPGKFVDRRVLASAVTGDPHALDQGSMLAAFVMAILVAAQRVRPLQSPRQAWAAVGVRCDDIVGGLIALGILPTSWILPPRVPVTLPPRVLSRCDWPGAPSTDNWVFVTENPSVLSAAADLPEGNTAPLLCTNGTPSEVEINAIARLASRGWRVAVRADFDPAGIMHVSAMLNAMPDAVPWRMARSDYLESLASSLSEKALVDPIPETEWDVELAATLRERGIPAYEELLLPVLLEDLQRGYPPNANDRPSS